MLYSSYPQIKEFTEYLTYEKCYSKNTINSYKSDLEQFFEFLISHFKGPKIKAIKPILIRSWIVEMKDRNISNATLNHKITCLRSFFKNEVKKGSIIHSPMRTITGFKIKKRLAEFVTEGDMDMLRNETKFEKDFKSQTNELAIDILYSTGMRLNELISIEEKNYDHSNMQIKILGKGNKERILPISNEISKNIIGYLSTKKKVFETKGKTLLVNEKGERLSQKTIYNAVRKYLSSITSLNKKSPHILRHTFATHLSNKGANLGAIKNLLGHSSLAATQVYVHNNIDRLKEIHKKSHPRA